eukprot:14467143-Ditylum_brightwellii.AAC.2
MSTSSCCQHQSKWTALTFVCGTLFCKLGRDKNVGFNHQSKFWRTWPESLTTAFEEFDGVALKMVLKLLGLVEVTGSKKCQIGFIHPNTRSAVMEQLEVSKTC